MRAYPLWQDPLDFMVAADHPLARPGTATRAELASLEAVLPGLDTFRQLVARCFGGLSSDCHAELPAAAADMGNHSLQQLAVDGVQLERTLCYASQKIAIATPVAKASPNSRAASRSACAGQPWIICGSVACENGMPRKIRWASPTAP